MTGTIAVVVASYNRPKMLREALASIKGADQIIIADDGSDFDVSLLAAEWVLGPKVSPEERMSRPSCGRLLNAAIRKVRCDYVTVLCDDDLLAPGWLPVAAAALDEHPEWHMVVGQWGTFQDGETPDPAKLCRFDFEIPATAGNFVYRTTCATEEGCWWREDTQAVHDGPMLWDYLQAHDRGYRERTHRRRWLGELDVLAGYRREHPKTISNHSLFGGDRYLPDALEMFAVPGGME